MINRETLLKRIIKYRFKHNKDHSIVIRLSDLYYVKIIVRYFINCIDSLKTLPIESLITKSALESAEVELLFISTRFLPLKYSISPAAG